jgi:U3 small nucleolar RNA-associated protein 6
MRRQLQPSDYFSYIKYETNLFKLLNIRHGKETDSAMKKQQRHVNALMVRHVSYVFERAIRRFPDEMEFWMEYIAFLKESQSTTLLNNVLGKGISLHPRNDTFWSLAAVSPTC